MCLEKNIIEHFHNILGNALVTNNGNIENKNLIRKKWQSKNQSIHINHGSHFTSHFKIYSEKEFLEYHSYWGNYLNYDNLFLKK
jgi:hypothetical protein